MIVVDGNNLAFKYKRMPHLMYTNKEGLPTGSIFGVLKHITILIKQFNDKKVLVCWDSKENLRKSQSSTYKANRDHSKDKKIFQQMNILYEVLPFFGISTVKVTGYEADDIAATIAEDRKDITFVSEDSDWLQYVINGNILYKKKVVVKEPLDYDYALYHSIVGCRKDNVIGIKRYSHKHAKDLPVAYKQHTMEEVLEYENDNDVLQEHRRLLLLNYDLLVPKYVKGLYRQVRKAFLYKPILKYLCEYFNFKTIYSDILYVLECV